MTDGITSTTLEDLLAAAVSGEGILTLNAEAGVVFASLQIADGDFTARRSIGDIDLSDTSQSLNGQVLTKRRWRRLHHIVVRPMIYLKFRTTLRAQPTWLSMAKSSAKML